MSSQVSEQASSPGGQAMRHCQIALHSGDAGQSQYRVLQAADSKAQLVHASPKLWQPLFPPWLPPAPPSDPPWPPVAPEPDVEPVSKTASLSQSICMAARTTKRAVTKLKRRIRGLL